MSIRFEFSADLTFIYFMGDLQIHNKKKGLGMLFLQRVFQDVKTSSYEVKVCSFGPDVINAN